MDTGDICCHYWQHILVIRVDILVLQYQETLTWIILSFLCLKWRKNVVNDLISFNLGNIIVAQFKLILAWAIPVCVMMHGQFSCGTSIQGSFGQFMLLYPSCAYFFFFQKSVCICIFCCSMTLELYRKWKFKLKITRIWICLCYAVNVMPADDLAFKEAIYFRHLEAWFHRVGIELSAHIRRVKHSSKLWIDGNISMA